MRAMSYQHAHARQVATVELRRVRAREAGLALAARVNRSMIAGAAILAAGLTAVTAHAFHQRSAPAVRSATPRVTRAVHAHGSGEDHHRVPLQAPPTTPASAAPTPSPAPVVSGGS